MEILVSQRPKVINNRKIKEEDINHSEPTFYNPQEKTTYTTTYSFDIVGYRILYKDKVLKEKAYYTSEKLYLN